MFFFNYVYLLFDVLTISNAINDIFLYLCLSGPTRTSARTGQAAQEASAGFEGPPHAADFLMLLTTCFQINPTEIDLFKTPGDGFACILH